MFKQPNWLESGIINIIIMVAITYKWGVEAGQGFLTVCIILWIIKKVFQSYRRK